MRGEANGFWVIEAGDAAIDCTLWLRDERDFRPAPHSRFPVKENITKERAADSACLPREEVILREKSMLGWALTFLVIAIIAGVFGFGGIAVASAGIAKIIFYVFLVLLVVSLVAHFLRGRSI